MEQHETRQNEQKNNDLDLDLEDGGNFKIDDREVVNPYEMENDNQNDVRKEDNGSNQKNGEDDWDF